MKSSVLAIFCSCMLLIGCVTQPVYECDANKLESTPANRFEINQTDGTVFDTKTKLTWKVCAEGQIYAGGQCTGNSTFFTWNNAVHAFGTNGKTWRLASLDELNSIVEVRCQNPAINMKIFPNTIWSAFWTASPEDTSSNDAWFVNFSSGYSNTISKDNSFHVRLVRGEQWVDYQKKDEIKRAQAVAKQRQELEMAALQMASKAERDAFVTCHDKTSCDKTFALTQIYINSMASQKIQVATDTIIETYNPTEYGNIGMGAVKIPGKGSSAIIRLTVTCKIDDGGHFDKYCESKKLNIYMGFRPFVNQMLNEK